MIRSMIFMVLMLSSIGGYSQISVAINADKDTITFGDEVQINYKINVPQGVEIDALDFSSIKEVSNYAFTANPEVFDSLMDVDVLDGGVFKIDNYNLNVTKDRIQGPIPTAGSIKVRVSSAGVMLLPKPKVIHTSGLNEINLNNAPLYVLGLADMEDINPNWNIIEEEITWRDYLKYVYSFLGIAVLFAGLYFIFTYLRKGKKEEEIKAVEIILPAHEIALRDLNILKGKELWQNGDTKGYHTELTRIMRQYIEDRYSIQALEMTSSQLKREMNKQEIDSDIVRRFDDILQIADKVKFAKGKTGPEMNIEFMDEAFNIVAETKEIKTENVEVK